MSEAVLLSLLLRCPSPAALSRHVEGGHLFPLLRRLEQHGYVHRRGELYRLTRRGKRELELVCALRLVTARALGPC